MTPDDAVSATMVVAYSNGTRVRIQIGGELVGRILELIAGGEQ